MTNPFQQALHTGAVSKAALAVFCANVLLFVLLAGLAVVSLLSQRRLSRGLVARMAVSLAMAVLLSLVAGPPPAPLFVAGPIAVMARHLATRAHHSLDLLGAWPSPRSASR